MLLNKSIIPTIGLHTSPTWIAEYISHKLGIANMVWTRRLNCGVQSLAYLGISIPKWLNTMWLWFEKTAAWVQVIQMS